MMFVHYSAVGVHVSKDLALISVRQMDDNVDHWRDLMDWLNYSYHQRLHCPLFAAAAAAADY